ncbi:MAG TPA: hypothetical protein VK718_05480 [Ferruginibacter sp.]|jgi:hypothetical protein|nr:hypothetical protein [Ferruginibacter sp.]
MSDVRSPKSKKKAPAKKAAPKKKAVATKTVKEKDGISKIIEDILKLPEEAKTAIRKAIKTNLKGIKKAKKDTKKK